MTNKEAIKIIKAECYVFNPLNLDRTQIVNTALDRACKALEQEPKTGHWEWVQYDKPSIGNWHCSECGRMVFLLRSQKLGENPLYDYCPWCGTRMAESEE